MERKPVNSDRNFVREVDAAWHKNLDGFFRTGGILLDARKHVGHGSWKKWVSKNLPFGYDTANRLCKIAECDHLRKVAHEQLLPICYTTLAILADLPPQDFQFALESDDISPDMSRHDAYMLGKRNAKATCRVSCRG